MATTKRVSCKCNDGCRETGWCLRVAAVEVLRDGKWIPVCDHCTSLADKAERPLGGK